MQNTTAPAFHPLFADPAADTVLRSSDGVLFRAPSATLRRAAGYFAATLPATADTEPAPAVTLARVLCALCGVPPPPTAPPLDLAGAEAMLALAAHWDAPGAAARVRDSLGGAAFLAEPLRLYALAARAGWVEEAQGAARGTLALALFDDAHREALARVPARDLLALLALHRRRRDVLDGMLSGWDAQGVGAALVSGRCGACGARTEKYDHVWREFRARIFHEMDVRPLGDTVTGFAGEEWNQARACWSAKCGGAECGKLLYDKDAILQQIKGCIERLPDTV
ncbi:hypothetical protein B0H15DRAFT_806696 [Mycena belliarum]|uniref:BTB domain-containing protein n=1 Tax=Mycena belliarum TaxID=1033014 RepID=A0AAD6TMZ3_9AGAR|nr:hypothetical protein B0H15DRAFT_806696 [Mycena belliae]